MTKYLQEANRWQFIQLHFLWLDMWTDSTASV